MNNMSECEARLLKLKRYLPFLHRTKDYLASSPGESLKITHLIDIISNAGEQLLAETLERCENFCRTLYLKFGKEDEMKIKMESNLGADVRPNARDRYDNSQHSFRAGADYETPRSPSPEETKRFSLNCIPKAIPNQRADSDLRIKSAAPIRQEQPVNRRRSPIAEHSSRPLRTEPIEIPTMPLHSSGVGSVSNQDQDYRSVYEQPNANGRALSYEDRHVSYNNRGPPDLQLAGTQQFPKRESRFDRYGGDRSSLSLGAGRSYEEPFHSNNQQPNYREPAWDRDRNHSGERDRSFRGPSNSGPPPSRSRWDTPSSQHFASKSGRPTTDNLRDSGGQQHSSSSFRSSEPPRLERQGGSRHESNYGKGGWSNRDHSPPVPHHSSFDRDSKGGRSFRQNEPSSRHVPSSHPASSEYSVPNSSAPRAPNYPSNSASPHQNATQASPSPARREDPRLANRSKSSGMQSPPSSTQSINPPKSNPPPNSVPSQSNSTAVASQQQRFSSSSTSSPSLSRLADSRNNRRPPPNKTPVQSQPPPPNKVNSNPPPPKTNKKETETRPPPPATDSGTNSRNQDEFVSPLDSLYTGASKPGQTGRGYGVQSYKIPKKKTNFVDRSNGKRLDESTMISPESSSINELTIDTDAANEDNDEPIREDEQNSTDNKKSEKSDDSSIPLEVIEQILKKNLPSDDVVKVLDRLKTNTEVSEISKTSSSTGQSTSASPGVDTTVTSSGDVVLLDTSEDEEKSSTPVSKDVTSSGPQVSEESSNKKKGKSRLPLEVARLREDLTDFMKGGIELGSRRCRSKSAVPADVTSEDDQRAKLPATRGRKRKATALEEGDSTTFSPVPASEDNDNLDDTGSTYSSSLEPNSAVESLAEFPAGRGQTTSNRGCKKKRGGAGGRGKKARPTNKDPDAGASKTRMRKKPLVPTHLSLRGRRSMYEDSEPNEQVEENDTRASSSGDQYFQCQKCSYLGQKIIHHYVNEHSGVEIPFVAMPESEWEAISSQGSASVPAHYRVDTVLLSDLSWIPARPNYTSPVQCKLCPYTTCKRSELMEHVMVHALPANCKYRCTLCGLTETNFFDMLDHIAGHTGEFRYRCNYCDFRVAHRPGIKHHMSSMHESQDGLFYTTIAIATIADADQLWIHGFVCRTCRYVQMTEERLERHQALHEECDGYRKVNLISLVQDANAPAPVEPENQIGPPEKESGVFMCAELDRVRRNDDLDESKLTETLKPRSVSFIETLAEKLANPDSVVEFKTPISKVDDSPVIQLVDSPKEETLRINVKNPVTKKDEEPGKKDEAVQMEISNEVENVVEEPVDPPRPLTEVWKPNVLLETTILKLVDKLGPEVETPSELSTDIEETEDIEESLEEEEEEEESSDDSEESESQDESIVEKIVPEEKEAAVENEVEASTDSSGFLRIENVISLIDNDEGDCLDPITSILPYSSVTIAKNEVTFPYSTTHDRAKFAAQLKDGETYKKMLDRTRLKNLFKCMGYCCIFSSDSPDDFTNHLEWHKKRYFTPNPSQSIREQRMLPENGDYTGETLTLPDFYLCSCCPFGANSPIELTDHVESTHGRSPFQCSACFFRAQSSKIVTIHAIISHNGNQSAFALDCKRVGAFKPKMEPEQLSLIQVPRYRCTVDNCGFACIQRSSLIQHLSTVHTGVKHFNCRQCTKSIVCNNSDYTQFFLHMNVHEMGFFQCAFCLWGSDLPTDALIHLCLHHPSLDGKLFTRSSQAAPVALKTLLKFWKPGLPNAYTQSHRLHLDQRYTDLFDKVVIIENILSPEEDIVTITTDVVQEKAIEEPVDVDDREVEEDASANRKEPEAEFHGFGEEEQAKAKQQTECILIESDPEEENTLNEPLATIPPNEEAVEQEDLEEHQNGLYGRKLYMCGNIGCDETAETATAFKDHLLVCDLARDSRLLTCRHCGKNMKLVSNLIEHLRSHGVRRYLCGLCSYRANQAVQVRKHMKALHRVGVVDEVSLGPGPGPASVDNVLHAFYPREMVARLKLRLRTPNKKGATTKTFSCRDAQNIPMKSILPFRVKCAHCGYASNVRTNMVRHLAMHECNETTNGTSSEGEEIIPRVIIPDQDPVNPVPHLETPSKGKMFDKMANLAYSSHVKEKPATKERMSTGAIEDPNGGDKSQPVFVPDHQRYVCGFNDCGHLTINESMLKYHLQTLHKNAVFSCPHCENDDDQLTLDAFRSHLKMHGPKLYKCGHCIYYHWQQHDIEYHLTEKHPNRPPWQIIVRDPSDAEVKRMQSTSQNVEKGGPMTPWNCCLCKQVAASAADMLVHVEVSHGIKSQFKCALCPVRCNVRSEFDRHFSSKHPNQDVQVLTMFYKTESNESASESDTTPVVASNFEPLWRKDDNRLRHIRGILLEENEMKNSNEAGSPTKVQPIDPVYGRYGSPSNGQFCCPMCDNYRVSYGRDLKIHLFRELDYKKFLCSICNEGSCSRQQALNHVGKQHPNSGAYIREITSDRALEDWVEKVIKTQTDALKLIKGTTASASKAKKSASNSPATSVPSSPVKSPAKAKKAPAATPSASAETTLSNSITITLSNTTTSPTVAAISSVTPALTITPVVQTVAKPTVITVNLDALTDVVISPIKKSFNCLSCQFPADSEQVLEEHVIATHASECTKAGKQICLECGFKASPKQSLINHQKKTKHSKTNELPTTDDGESETSLPTEAVAAVENAPQQSTNKRGRNKPLNPYRCKHCNFSALTEHGMNLHWQRIHSVCQLPLEFECDLPPEVTAAKPESAKIYYKCQLCPVQPGLYEEMREHCKMLHPNSPIRLFRITSKVRHQPESSADSGPLAKVARDDKATMNKEATATKPQSPKMTSKAAGPAASTSSQTVFVVAPTLTPAPPAYACVWCHSKFQQENQVIRHHATHPPNVPLRYTCLDTPKTTSTEPSLSTPPKPELAVMEIRFGCPVCPKYFISLAGAQQHVGEHKQAWKCGHCVMLFGTPTLALQHWKEVHPGLQGRLESIDSPSQIVEKLSKGITLIRVQLNMKSLLKDKPPQSPAQSKETFGAVKDSTTENSSIETPTPSQIPKSTAVARKSTSTNLFLKENVKQQQDPSTSPVTQDLPPALSEVTRITQS